MKLILKLYLFSLFLFVFSSSAWGGIKKGPYLQMVSQTSAVIAWETDSDSAGEVEWGPDESLVNIADSGSSTLHHIQLSELDSDTAYYYRVLSDNDESLVYRFRTAPSAGKPFRFVAFGDSRSGYSEHRRVAEAILQEQVSTYMNSGDLVCTGSDAMCWQEHFNIERDLMASVPLLPVIGNHDVDGSNCDNYKKYFILPDNGNSDFSEHYYYQDWGNSRLIALDCELASLGPGSPQYNWLLQVLSDAKNSAHIMHIFIGVHVGPYTAKPGRSGNGDLRQLEKTFLEYGVTAVFSGHDHHYYSGSGPEGLQFMVTGGGGASLYDCVPTTDWGVVNRVCYKGLNYVLLEVDGKTVRATAKTPDGEVLETLEFESAYDKEVPVDQPGSDDDDDNDNDTWIPGGDYDGASQGDGQPGATYDPEYGFAGCAVGASASVLIMVLFAGLFTFARRWRKL